MTFSTSLAKAPRKSIASAFWRWGSLALDLGVWTKLPKKGTKNVAMAFRERKRVGCKRGRKHVLTRLDLLANRTWRLWKNLMASPVNQGNLLIREELVSANRNFGEYRRGPRRVEVRDETIS